MLTVRNQNVIIVQEDSTDSGWWSPTTLELHTLEIIMFNEQTLAQICKLLIGKEIDYCFHLHTPYEQRERFVIRGITHEDNLINFLGNERMLAFNGMHTYGYIREGKLWIKEGFVYQFRDEELRIDGKSWQEFFTTSPTIRIPKGT